MRKQEKRMLRPWCARLPNGVIHMMIILMAPVSLAVALGGTLLTFLADWWRLFWAYYE